MKRLILSIILALLSGCDNTTCPPPQQQPVADPPICNSSNLNTIPWQDIRQDPNADSLIIVEFGLCTEDYAVLSASLCIDDLADGPGPLECRVYAGPDSVAFPYWLFRFKYDWTVFFPSGQLAATPLVSLMHRPMGVVSEVWGKCDTLILSTRRGL